MKKRVLTLALAGAMLASVLSGCASQPSSANTGTAAPAATQAGSTSGQKTEDVSNLAIRVNYDGAFCQVPIAVAYFKGYFKEEGLDNISLVKTGDSTSQTLLQAGEVDIVAGMTASWLVPVSNNVDVRFTLGLHTGCTSAYVKSGSAVTGFDSKPVSGQTKLRVGYATPANGPSHNIAIRFIAKLAHEKSLDDFTLAAFAPAAAIEALNSGLIDIAVLGDQFVVGGNLVGEGEGKVSRVASLHGTEEFLDESCCVLGFSGGFFDTHPAAVEKVTRAVYRAAKWIDASLENKRSAVQLLHDNGYPNIPPTELGAGLLDLFNWGVPNDQTQTTLYNSVDEYNQLGLFGKNPDGSNRQIEGDAFKALIWNPVDLSGIEK